MNSTKKNANANANIEFHCEDVLEHLKRQASCSIHTTFADPPYFLGSEWYQDENNRWQMKGQGKDFMNAWGVQNADWWREYFKELHRVMKYGGYVVMYSITQQSDMVSGLLREAGFEKCAENGSGTLHWATISNFPKASDCALAVDKRNGAKNRSIGFKVVGHDGRKAKLEQNMNLKGNFGSNNYAPATDLATLLNGYKYGKAPFKKITEPILVFRKAPKFGSVLNDLMQCQSDPEISPAILDIERNRVGIETIVNQGGVKSKKDGVYNPIKDWVETSHQGRYPCTQFMSPAAAEMLDSQLDVITFELNGKIYTTKRLEMVAMVSKAVQNNELTNFKELHCKRESLHSGDKLTKHNNSKSYQRYAEGNYVMPKLQQNKDYNGDSGYISRVMHQPDFTNDDYDSLISAYNAYSFGINEDTFYCPTVSPKERNKGCETLEKKNVEIMGTFEEGTKGKGLPSGNFHPTLKPIALNKHILGLFLLPSVFNQIVYIPFGGAGSELIAATLLGIKNIIYVEKKPDFVNIAKHRIKYYANIEVNTETTLQDQPLPKPKSIEQTKLF